MLLPTSSAADPLRLYDIPEFYAKTTTNGSGTAHHVRLGTQTGRCYSGVARSSAANIQSNATTR
jgi:hypothetical protein